MNVETNRTERSMADVQVLIVGAGPTGLVLAIWLTKLGVTVRIVDKTAEPGTSSRALAVCARTLEFYRQVGMADPLVEGGIKVPAANFWVRNRRVARLPLQGMGEGLTPFPFALVFPQDAHERVLVARLERLGVKVERRTELARFELKGGGVLATLERANGAEETCTASFIAGCDGAHSTVREALEIGFPGGTYAQIFYVADVEATGPATDGEIHVDLHDADFIAVFPLKGKGRMRLVGPVLGPQTEGHGQLTFEDVRERAIQHLKFTIDKVNWFSTYHVHHRVARKFRTGRAFLLGDAAHVHSPVGGQGMNTGIGDAVNLAWKLAAVLKGSASDSLLDSYERERIGFARRLVATTDRMFTLVTARGRLARFVRTRVLPLLSPLVFRLPGVRPFLFRTVSQIGIHYRQGPLSEGSAGTVRGGDRLPWVETGPQEDNFSSLSSLTWQVHVYGEPRHELAEACAGCRMPIQAFGWRPEMGRAGLVRGAIYLVRPDGYIALADGDGDPERLGRYFESRGLQAAAPQTRSTRV
jgi:2-polyprenyl-6-methoxyphenol hydroxylase-like FAD-dependent oxidoreductase